METLNVEEMREKVAKALELVRQRADQKKAKEKVNVVGPLKSKAKAPPHHRGPKRVAIETPVAEGSSPKHRGSVDMDALRDFPSGKMVASRSTGTSNTIVEITHRRDCEEGDDTFLGWNPDFQRK